MAALCHDLGHLPFSHVAEKELLPDGWDHEQITEEIILSGEFKSIWEEIKVAPEDVAKLAVGPEKYKTKVFTEWETILSEIITGDVLGADRMDYLLRDSYHAGVAYGRFDHYRLIDTIRVLPKTDPEEEEGSNEPCLGVEIGGLESAEALLLARYFMYSQIYFHPIRRIYDIHLKDFLKAWLPGGKFSTDVEAHLRMTDNEVNAEIIKAERDKEHPGHEYARRITRRQHFKILYRPTPHDKKMNPEAAEVIFEAAQQQFGEENVRHDKFTLTQTTDNFPVLVEERRISQALSEKESFSHVPPVVGDYIFINPDMEDEAKNWLEKKREEILSIRREENET